MYSLLEELKKAVENLWGHSIEGDSDTVADMLHKFNDQYGKCKVTVAKTPTAASFALYDAEDELIAPDANGKYWLPAGSYTYAAAAAGYIPVTEGSLTISAGDVSTGTKTLTVALAKYCVVSFDLTPEDLELTVYDALSAEVSPEEDGTYKLAAGNYTYDAEAAEYTSKTGEALAISAGDVTTGTKTVTVTLTLS